MAKFNVSKIKSDPAAESEGVWTDDLGHGLKLRIARIGSPRYLAELRGFRQKAGTAQPFADLNDDLPDARSVDDATMHAMARHVLVGWSGMYEEATEEQLADMAARNEPCPEDGLVEVAYSHETAERLLRESRELYLIVLQFGADTERFRARRNKADAGN